MLNFDIQNHKPLREMVYEELKMQILTGAIVPGTRMMEVELANQIGVSRTPIREAIRKLEKEGLVVIEPRRGAYASQISTKDMVEILEVRQNMEGLAAFFAASRMQPEQLDDLKEVAEKYNRAVADGNMEDMITYDTRFHRIIVESVSYTHLDVYKRQCQHHTYSDDHACSLFESLQRLRIFHRLYTHICRPEIHLPDEQADVQHSAQCIRTIVSVYQHVIAKIEIQCVYQSRTYHEIADRSQQPLVSR